jgi:TolB protein
VASCGVGPSASTATAPDLAGRIVFVDRPVTPGPLSVYTIAPNGSQRKLLTTPASGIDDRHPRLSPDGTRILFDRGGDQIMLVQADGSGLRTITKDCIGSCLGDEAPAWSPDGTQIAFERAVGPLDNGTPRDIGIWTASADGSHPHQLTQLKPGSGWQDSFPSFSPDGRRLVFLRDGDQAENLDQSSIWTVAVDGTGARLVYRLPDDRPGGGGKPRWSPDGSLILFSDFCAFDSCRPAPPFVAQAYTVRTDGTDLHQVTTGSADSVHPAWSPDGKSIVFARSVDSALAACVVGRAELYVMKADGTDLRRVTASTASGCKPKYPDWGV